MSQTNLLSSGREFSVQPLMRALTPFLVLPGASALVGVSYVLGAQWLANPAMGIPAGAWLVILATAGSKLVVDERARALPVDEAPLAPTTRAKWPEGSVVGTMLDVSGRLAGATVRVVDRALRTNFQDHLSAAHDTIAWPTRPLRIGLRAGAELVRTLPEISGTCPVEWFTLSGSTDAATACRRHLLDAVVWSSADEAEILTSVSPGAEASWYDWAAQRPLSYASVFPHALDPERVTLAGDAGPLEGAPRVARALVEAAASLSRRPERLDLGDRLRGRRPDQDIAARDGYSPADEPARLGDGALDALAEAVAKDVDPARSTHLERVAARVVTAHLATREMDHARRLRLMEHAAEIVAAEPEVLLRLAAARFGALRDGPAFEALARADYALRESAAVAVPDPFEFIQSELTMGCGGALSVGRVAAGICLLCAHTPRERLRYLRDDLMDDMRYSGWLVGADPDRRLLMDVFCVLERSAGPRVVDMAGARAA